MFTKEEVAAAIEELNQLFRTDENYLAEREDVSSPHITFSMDGYEYYSTWGAPRNMSQQMIDWILKKAPGTAEHWRMGHFGSVANQPNIVLRGNKAHFRGALQFWTLSIYYNYIIRSESLIGGPDEDLFKKIDEENIKNYEDKLIVALSNHFIDGIDSSLMECHLTYKRYGHYVWLYETENEFILHVKNLY